jgi:membrane fusion protein (multidrug efflux system)
MTDLPEPTSPEHSPPAFPGTKRKRLIPLFLLAAAATGGGVWWHSGAGLVSTDDAFVEADITDVRPEVAGRVVQVFVSDNQTVRAGQPLFRIDPSSYQIRVAQAAAQVAATEQQIATARLQSAQTRVQSPAVLRGADAEVVSAAATLDRATSDLARLRSVDPRVTTPQVIDQAVAAQRSALGSLNDARARQAAASTSGTQIAIADSKVGELLDALAMEKAELAAAQLDLQKTFVVASVPGRIGKRTAEVGGFVSPGQLIAVVAQPDPWIEANFKETQLADVRVGQPVSIRVDAYPDLKISGVVDSFQPGSGSSFSAFPAENATGNFVKVVQRVPVKIRILHGLDPSRPLDTGMSVEPTVDTRDSARHG